MITYERKSETEITVKFNGKVAGSIKTEYVGTDAKYYYQPKGSKLRGDDFQTIGAVKDSLESE